MLRIGVAYERRPKAAFATSPTCVGADAGSATRAKRRIIAMSKSEADLSPKEWQARHDAAGASLLLFTAGYATRRAP